MTSDRFGLLPRFRIGMPSVVPVTELRDRPLSEVRCPKSVVLK